MNRAAVGRGAALTGFGRIAPPTHRSIQNMARWFRISCSELPEHASVVERRAIDSALINAFRIAAFYPPPGLGANSASKEVCRSNERLAKLSTRRPGCRTPRWGPAVEPMVVDTLGGRMQVCWDGSSHATPNGQLVFFAEFLRAAGVFDGWAACRMRWSSRGSLTSTRASSHCTGDRKARRSATTRTSRGAQVASRTRTGLVTFGWCSMCRSVRANSRPRRMRRPGLGGCSTNWVAGVWR